MNYESLIDFADWIIEDIFAVFPYVFPMLMVGSMLFFYQRHLPQESTKRNGLVLAIIILYGGGFFFLFTAAFGNGAIITQWGFWDEFMGVIQVLTDLIFTSIYGAIGYVLLIAAIFAGGMLVVVSPPDPDFVALREDLQAEKASAEHAQGELQKIEAENKRLNEFIGEKEEALAALEGELEVLKSQVDERERTLGEMETRLAAGPPSAGEGTEEELLATISNKDQTISTLQDEIANLRLMLETKPAAAPPSESAERSDAMVKQYEMKLEDFKRRAETASQVADSLISDLAELMSQVDRSPINEAAKDALRGLVEELGRSVNRLAGPPGERGAGDARIEMIGAVMIVHEIMDGVKKIARS
jgi:hypothetical protein